MLSYEIAVLAKLTPVFMGLADLAYFLKEENDFSMQESLENTLLHVFD